ncbi:MAG: hypothetical protein U0132_18965 [Gemmatimonadaceae bacterium]
MTRPLTRWMTLGLAVLLPATAFAQHAGHHQATDTTKKPMTHQMGGMGGMNGMAGMGNMSEMHRMMENMSPWKELNAFHMLLAEVYHPAAKDSLQPLRDKAAALSDAAAAWSASTAPASCNSDATTQGVAKIATDAKALATQVSGRASDADLKAGITALHTQFEGVGMKCMSHDKMDMKH